MAYFGEGGSSEGDFHEALNLAGVTRAPIVFFMPEQPMGDLDAVGSADAASTDRCAPTGYGFPGVEVDGNDVLAVYDGRGRCGGAGASAARARP